MEINREEHRKIFWADINILYFHRDLAYMDEGTCRNSVIVLTTCGFACMYILHQKKNYCKLILIILVNNCMLCTVVMSAIYFDIL